MSLANANQQTAEPAAISRVVTAIEIWDLSVGAWMKLTALVAGLIWLSQVRPRLLPFSAAIRIPTLLIAFLLAGLLK